MDQLLVATTTRSLRPGFQSSVDALTKSHPNGVCGEVTSSTEALEVLKSQPSLDELSKCLRWLSTSGPGQTFDVKAPSAAASQIITVLTGPIFQNFWGIFQTSLEDEDVRKSRTTYISCLRSLSGLSAILLAIRRALDEPQNTSQPVLKINGPTAKVNTAILKDYLALLTAILDGQEFISELYDVMQQRLDERQKRPYWTKCIQTLTNEKIVSTAVEASTVISKASTEIYDEPWTCSGEKYAEWLGKNIYSLIKAGSKPSKKRIEDSATLLSSAVILRYDEQIIGGIWKTVLSGQAEDLEYLSLQLENLSDLERRKTLFTILEMLSKCLNHNAEPNKVVGAVAWLIHWFLMKFPELNSDLEDWLDDEDCGAAILDIGIHRAVILALAKTNNLVPAMTRMLDRFSNKNYIKSTPIFSQEVLTKDLLIGISHLRRDDHSALEDFARSGAFVNSISNHLGDASDRAKFLGMVIGGTVSGFVDPPERRMTFETDLLDKTQAAEYRDLADLKDELGRLEDLQGPKISVNSTKASIAQTLPIRTAKPRLPKKVPPPAPKPSKITIIEEINDDESDDDLPTYAKPDSDPEDSDDDPTAIRRDKPKAPVYIRELLVGLLEQEDFDKHNLALKSAAGLIRRKTNFGTEVSDHVEQLATYLIGLKNNTELEDFDNLRLQGLIAVLVSSPLKMGQWFSNTFFNGDFSIGQRIAALSTMTFGARELAGYKAEDEGVTGAPSLPASQQKQLKNKQTRQTALDQVAESFETGLIKPMAFKAADIVSGPDALKVRKISSSMEVKKRTRIITNELAKIVADGMIYPLIGRFHAIVRHQGQHSVFLEPYLLSHFLRSISLILHASGSSTLSLPNLSADFWTLLLSLRREALNAQPVLEALLFSFMVILVVNEHDERRLATEHAVQMLETKRWVDKVFEMTAGKSEEGERIRMLSASILVKIQDVSDKYKQLMFGATLGYV